MKVLLLGGTGRLGAQVRTVLERERVAVNAPTRAQLDLAAMKTPEAWRPWLREVDVIVHAAGWLREEPGNPPGQGEAMRIGDNLMRACDVKTGEMRRFVTSIPARRQAPTQTPPLRCAIRGCVIDGPLRLEINRPSGCTPRALPSLPPRLSACPLRSSRRCEFR